MIWKVENFYKKRDIHISEKTIFREIKSTQTETQNHRE